MNAYKRYNYIYLGIYIFVFFSLNNVLAFVRLLDGWSRRYSRGARDQESTFLLQVGRRFPFCRKEAGMSLYFYYYKRSFLSCRCLELFKLVFCTFFSTFLFISNVLLLRFFLVYSILYPEVCFILFLMLVTYFRRFSHKFWIVGCLILIVSFRIVMWKA